MINPIRLLVTPRVIRVPDIRPGDRLPFLAGTEEVLELASPVSGPPSSQTSRPTASGDSPS